MSDSDFSSDFRADVSGDPEGQPGTEEESPPSDDDSPSRGSLPYDPEEPIRILFRGHAESYDQSFVVALHVEFRDDCVFLEDLSALVGSDRSVLDRVDAEAPFSSVIRNITQAINRLSSSKRKDAQNFRNKLERVLHEPEKLEELTEPLRQNRNKDFHDSLHEFLLSEMFPGSELRTGARVLSVEGTDYEDQAQKGEDAGTGDDQSDGIVAEGEKSSSDDSPNMLELRPEYDPMDGVSLCQLRPGDKFNVRVVGDSLYDLKAEYLDGEDPAGADQSKIMNAELEDVRDAPLKSVKTFALRPPTSFAGCSCRRFLQGYGNGSLTSLICSN